jgi:hypothetical protein
MQPAAPERAFPNRWNRSRGSIYSEIALGHGYFGSSGRRIFQTFSVVVYSL